MRGVGAQVPCGPPVTPRRGPETGLQHFFQAGPCPGVAPSPQNAPTGLLIAWR
jgi:hypothetical protein